MRPSIALEPRAAYAYNALGFAYLGLGRLAEARQAFANALARAPRWSYPTTGLGLVDALADDPERMSGARLVASHSRPRRWQRLPGARGAHAS